MAWKATLDELIASGDFRTQTELVNALSGRGHGVTQATVSRQLAAIGVVKVSGVYRHAPPVEIGAPILAVAVAGGGCMVVVRTVPAHASVVAHVIDRELSLNPECAGVLGTVAGDDTVLVLLAAPNAVGELYRLLGWRVQAPASAAAVSRP